MNEETKMLLNKWNIERNEMRSQLRREAIRQCLKSDRDNAAYMYINALESIIEEFISDNPKLNKKGRFLADIYQGYKAILRINQQDSWF